MDDIEKMMLGLKRIAQKQLDRMTPQQFMLAPELHNFFDENNVYKEMK